MDLGGVRGNKGDEYDQHTLHKLHKELIKNTILKIFI